MLNEQNKKELKKILLERKIDVINMLAEAKSGHVGGAFSIADILVYIYYKFVKVDPTNPNWDKRDYVLLSNGHVCPIWYSILADRGFFPKSELLKSRKIDSLLQGHPKSSIPGVENSSGPLGHGLSQAVGIALGLKMDKKENKVICIMSDGEQNEGQVTEAAMSASKFKLNNLIAIIDKNNIQIDGTTDEIMPLGDLRMRYESLDWLVVEIDGHNFDEIESALKIENTTEHPLLIIAHTIAGESVSFMEGRHEYHDWKNSEEDRENALKELNLHLSKLQ
jgi:transketolase